MQNLSVQTLCDGMIRVRDNVVSLLDDAKLLRQNGRISRAYTLAYMACEEAGKLSILLGAATRTVLGIPVDWKATRKRFRSHDSKASQFLASARTIPMIRMAAEAECKSVDVEAMMMKAAVGVVIGPALFTKRNASVYCDFVENSFTSPKDQIEDKMADQMIEFAEQHLAAAGLILGNSAEEAASNLTAQATHERYDLIMARVADATELAVAALSMLQESKSTEQVPKADQQESP